MLQSLCRALAIARKFCHCPWRALPIPISPNALPRSTRMPKKGTSCESLLFLHNTCRTSHPSSGAESHIQHASSRRYKGSCRANSHHEHRCPTQSRLQLQSFQPSSTATSNGLVLPPMWHRAWSLSTKLLSSPIDTADSSSTTTTGIVVGLLDNVWSMLVMLLAPRVKTQPHQISSNFHRTSRHNQGDLMDWSLFLVGCGGDGTEELQETTRES
jgi:hypothetical protein